MKDHNYSNSIIKSLKNCSSNEKNIIKDGLILMDLHREIEMFADIMGSKRGLPVRQMEILEILYNYPENKLTPAEIADEVHLTRSTMTGNLDNLQNKGFISRESHPNDRRMTLIKLTKAGITFCEEIMPQRYSDIRKVIGALTSEDRDHMKRIYTKLLSVIKELAMEEND